MEALDGWLNIRIEQKNKELLEKVSSLRGESPSTFTRRAILRALGELSYLPEDQKKALSLPTGTG